MLGYHNVKLHCRQAKYLEYSAARQLFVYTKNNTRKCYVNHNMHNLAWVGAKLGRAFNCMWS